MTAAVDYAAIFGSNVRASRLRAGLKLAEMSERTGISLSDLSLIEHGGLAVTIQTMAVVAEAVECPLSTLLELDGVEPTDQDVADAERE